MEKQISLFKKYAKPVFIETGSFVGDGISYAISAGIEKIYSIEVVSRLYEHCKARFEYFEKKEKVFLIQGDSATEIENILSNINEECVFWLDGHWSQGMTGHNGKKESPLLEELEQIAKHHIKTHTILIDDLRCWNTTAEDAVSHKKKNFDVEILKEKILLINKNYKFTYETIRDRFPNDVLAAYVPN